MYSITALVSMLPRKQVLSYCRLKERDAKATGHSGAFRVRRLEDLTVFSRLFCHEKFCILSPLHESMSKF